MEIKLPNSFSYIGSKMKLLDWISNNIELYTNKTLKDIDSFADLFSGTGVVAYYMIQKGIKNITSNDIEYYAFITSSVWTTNNIDKIKLSNIIDILNNINKQVPTNDDFIYNTYSPGCKDIPRMFFTKSNSLKIDKIRQEIEKLKTNLTDEEYKYLIKILLYASIKVGNISSTWGAYLKKFKSSSLNDLILNKEMLNLLVDNNINHVSFNKDIFELLDQQDFKDTEICYLDSPYNNRVYENNYHILNVISKYNSPEIKGKTGLLVEQKSGSKLFCSKINAKKSFENILSKIKSKFIFISYSSESIVSKQEIITILNKDWENVVCYEKEYKRFKSNNNNIQDKTIKEYLFAATNKIK
jgi:adenine-specific DNA-methyltransferase